MKDKSNGKGCIGCPVKTGKTCDGCTHRNDIANECKAILAEAKEQEQIK